MPLVDMKREAKKGKRGGGPVSMDDEGGYHHGLKVHLGEDEMGKLGLDTPRVGDKLHIIAHGHVHSVSEDTDAEGNTRRSVGIELRKMQVGKGKASEEDLNKGARAAIDKAVEDKDEDGE